MGEATTQGPLPAEEYPNHLDNVARGFEKGRVTPVLGAGVNLSSRPEYDDNSMWLRKFPPSSGELTAYLTDCFKLTGERSKDLLRVTQRICDTKGGEGPLFDELHDVFAHKFVPTVVHDFLAALPGEFHHRDLPVNIPLIVTTNYDDLMEAALDKAGEKFDLLVYVANGPWEGKFCHRPPEGKLAPIELNGDGQGPAIDPTQRMVVLKLHGFVDSSHRDADSYVITEDHYIEYLTRIELEHKLPDSVLSVLRNSHLLFLGYSLRDWNLRAMLHKLRAEQLSNRDWWSVQLRPDPLEVLSWARRGIQIVDKPLDEYTQDLKHLLLKSGAPEL